MQNNVPPAEVEPSAFPQKNISSPDWLEELALTLTQNIRLVPHPGSTTPLPARLRILGIFFQAAYRYFEKPNQTETTVLHTAEWLLDNFYITLTVVATGTDVDVLTLLEQAAVANPRSRMKRTMSIFFAFMVLPFQTLEI
jgi:hypothetical protein